MKKDLFCVYDKVAQAVATTLLMSDKVEVLKRDLKSTKLMPQMEAYPKDFELVKIGTIDLDKAIIEPCHEVICSLEELKDGTNQC